MKIAHLIQAGNCAPHQTDSELMGRYLQNNGWSLTDDIKKANIVIINTCGFIKEYEDKSFELIKKADSKKKSSAKIIVTGCLPSINSSKLNRVFKGIKISANSLEELSKVLKISTNIRETKYIGKPNLYKDNNNLEYLLRIGWGCQGNCSYCAIKSVFGKPKSRSVNEILDELHAAYIHGYRRYNLVGHDVGSYGKDIDTNLINLISQLSRKYKDCSFRIFDINPDTLKKMLPYLEKFIRSGSVFHVKVPVQSGNDRIIRLMNRRYTASDFKYCIRKLRNFSPDLEIVTDIMVGFPSETENDFKDTLRMVGWLIKNKVMILCAYYSKRPNTKAGTMNNQVKEVIKRNRFKRLTDLCLMDNWIGEKVIFTQLKQKYSCPNL